MTLTSAPSLWPALSTRLRLSRELCSHEHLQFSGSQSSHPKCLLSSKASEVTRVPLTGVPRQLIFQTWRHWAILICGQRIHTATSPCPYADSPKSLPPSLTPQRSSHPTHSQKILPPAPQETGPTSHTRIHILSASLPSLPTKLKECQVALFLRGVWKNPTVHVLTAAGTCSLTYLSSVPPSLGSFNYFSKHLHLSWC